MLSSAKPILQTQLLQILQKAAYEMYMTQYSRNTIEEAGKYDGDRENKMKQFANEFSIKFAQSASGPVSTAIYDFVKEMGIMITVPPSAIAPPLPPVLPGGPCSGTIPMTNIQVL
jgi:hypothetical protein